MEEYQVERQRDAAANALLNPSLLTLYCYKQGLTPGAARLKLFKELSGVPQKTVNSFPLPSNSLQSVSVESDPTSIGPQESEVDEDIEDEAQELLIDEPQLPLNVGVAGDQPAHFQPPLAEHQLPVAAQQPALHQPQHAQQQAPVAAEAAGEAVDEHAATVALLQFHADQAEHPQVREACEAVIRAVQSHEIAPGEACRALLEAVYALNVQHNPPSVGVIVDEVQDRQRQEWAAAATALQDLSVEVDDQLLQQAFAAAISVLLEGQPSQQGVAALAAIQNIIAEQQQHTGAAHGRLPAELAGGLRQLAQHLLSSSLAAVDRVTSAITLFREPDPALLAQFHDERLVPPEVAAFYFANLAEQQAAEPRVNLPSRDALAAGLEALQNEQLQAADILHTLVTALLDRRQR